MDIILVSIKKLLGIDTTYTHFDDDIVMNINSALMNLLQFGIGPESGFQIITGTETWSSLLDSRTDLNAIKMYVYYQTRLGFDPPSSSFVLEAMERRVEELVWRIQLQGEQV